MYEYRFYFVLLNEKTAAKLTKRENCLEISHNCKWHQNIHDRLKVPLKKVKKICL